MRPLPRLLAIADDAVCQADDFAIKAAAILSVGPSVAILVRSRSPAARAHLLRVRSLARPSEGGTFGYLDAAMAREAGAQGLVVPGSLTGKKAFRRAQVHAGEVSVGFDGAIGCEVESIGAARAAVDDGADFLVVGPPGPATMAPWWAEAVGFGRPVFLPGDGTDEHRARLQATGGYGMSVAATVWESRDPADTAAALVAGWTPA